MSQALPDINFSGAGVGTTKTIDTSSIPVAGINDPNNPAHLNIWNDSGCGCGIRFKTSNHTDNIPAGGWRTYELVPGEAGIVFTVKYVIPNSPVSTCMSTYYAPGENVPDPGILGNSPIGGAVATSSIQTLSNEGSPRGILVIDLGDNVFGQLVKMINDGSAIWNVDIAGVLHNIFNISSSGSGAPLTIGQNGDHTSFPGIIDVGQVINFTQLSGGGSLRGISQFTGSTVVGKTTVNHNLGTTPDFVIPQFSVGSTPSPHIIATNFATFTPTTCDIWSDIGGIGFFGLAFALH